jgi:hypothetical protein
MSELDDSFTQLLGRQSTDKERQDLYRVRDALKLKTTDAVWLLLMALQYYETLYEKVPALITNAARDATKAARVTAEAQAKAAQEETKRALMDAVHQAAVVSTKQAAGAQLLKWIGIAAAMICGAFVIVAAGAYRRGREAGFADGTNEARARYENAAVAASWANTPEGQVALGMARVGSLRELTACSAHGLARRDGWCVVQSERGKIVYRWRLPSTDSRDQ